MKNIRHIGLIHDVTRGQLSDRRVQNNRRRWSVSPITYSQRLLRRFSRHSPPMRLDTAVFSISEQLKSVEELADRLRKRQ